MKFFGRKAGAATPRPPLAHAWLASGWNGIGNWPHNYEAQLREAVLAKARW